MLIIGDLVVVQMYELYALILTNSHSGNNTEQNRSICLLT